MGPDSVISQVSSLMKNNKKSIQHKPVLHFLLQVIVDFEASAINVKSIIAYLQTPQVFSNHCCWEIGIIKYNAWCEEWMLFDFGRITETARIDDYSVGRALWHSRAAEEDDFIPVGFIVDWERIGNKR